MKTLTLAIAFLTILTVVAVANAQISCFSYGSVVSCDGPRNSNTTQFQFNRSQGTIMDSQGNMEPYMIQPSTPQPSRPLNDVLPKLPTLQPLPERPQSSSFQELNRPLFLPMGIGSDGSQ